MADLKSERVNGFYQIGGKRYPSVTTIIGKMKKNDGYLDDWKKKNENWEQLRDRAATTGTIMHSRILQQYSDAQIELANVLPISDWPPELEEELEKRDTAWRNLDLRIKEVTVEKTIVIKRYVGAEAAGTLDARGMIEGFRAILDLKSSKKIYDSQWIQVGAYYLGSLEDGFDADRGFIVALRGDQCEVGEIEKNELVEYGDKFIDLALEFHRKFMAE